MLSFQLSSFLLNALPPCVWLVTGLYSAIVKIIRGRTAADTFADVVKTAMKQDPNVLARKYADKWMVKALGRGLLNRPLMHYEKRKQALPFDPAVPVRALGRGVTVTRNQLKKLKTLKRTDAHIDRNRGDMKDLVPMPSDVLDESINIDAAASSTSIVGISSGASGSGNLDSRAAIPSSKSSGTVETQLLNEDTIDSPSFSIDIGELSNADDIFDGINVDAVAEEEEEESHPAAGKEGRSRTKSQITRSGRQLGDRIATFEVPHSRPVLPASAWKKPEDRTSGSGSAAAAGAAEFSPACRITGGAWSAPSSSRTEDQQGISGSDEEDPSISKRIWWRP
jgi:hypothetical protein